MKLKIYQTDLIKFFYYAGFLLSFKETNLNKNLEIYFDQLLISNRMPLNSKWSCYLFSNFVKGYRNSSNSSKDLKKLVVDVN